MIQNTESNIFLLAVAGSLLASLVLTSAVRGVAFRFGLLDPCNDRSLHTEPLPRLGGIAIALSVAIGFGAIAWLIPGGLGMLGRPHLVLISGAAATHSSA